MHQTANCLSLPSIISQDSRLLNVFLFPSLISEEIAVSTGVNVSHLVYAKIYRPVRTVSCNSPVLGIILTFRSALSHYCFTEEYGRSSFISFSVFEVKSMQTSTLNESWLE